jgi:glycine/D-amino acid oxidase-like deaminating enzyme
MRTDYLIVGQGLAGTLVAKHFMDKGLAVKVVSRYGLTNASLVAGGLYNPITGRKMVKTWNCDALFQYLTPFYRTMEQELKTKFLHERPIYRPFLDIEAQNEWMGKSSDLSYTDYVDQVYTDSVYPVLQDDFGGIMLKQSGYLDTKTFVESFGKLLIDQNLAIDEEFDQNALKLEGDIIKYNEVEAEGIVFCDGIGALKNPLFDWLPFRPVKGELLTIESPHIPDVIYNRGVFVIGKSNNQCTVGATYDHSDLSLETTQKGKYQLIEKLEKLINFEYLVVNQKAGIRPATKDRRPFVGKHPKHQNVFILNGLGAKGVSLGPFYAKQLVNYIIGNGHIDEEVNIERYFSLF